MSRATVIGGGSWGATFAQVLADAGNQVAIWTRDQALAGRITDQHRWDRQGHQMDLPLAVTATNDLAAALAGTEIVAVAVPAQRAGDVLAGLRDHLPGGAIVVSLMKGIELAGARRMSQLIGDVLDLPEARVAAISGPNLSQEIAERQPAATVVASRQVATAQRVASACATPYLRPYINTDLVGVEICGAVKNIIAFAIGAARGLGLGLNTSATMLTRGLAEMTRLGLALGADVETFAGLAGTGDLMATSTSTKSRNHALGIRIGQGMGLAEAIAATGGTAESLETSRAVLDLARRVGVEMPITEGVVAVVHDGRPVLAVGEALMGRPLRLEGSGYVRWD